MPEPQRRQRQRRPLTVKQKRRSPHKGASVAGGFAELQAYAPLLGGERQWPEVPVAVALFIAGCRAARGRVGTLAPGSWLHSPARGPGAGAT